MREPIFILGPGRSFTSVIGSMIGQHPELFGLPETNLGTADTVERWYRILPGMDAFPAGVLRLLAHLHHGEQTVDAVNEVDVWLRSRSGMSTQGVYEHVEGLLGDRQVVDKSPLHSTTDACLRRLRRIAPNARYIRIARHPYSNGKSIVATEWYLEGLKAWGSSGWDRRTNPPTLDPQFHWLDVHDRIDRLFASLPSESYRTVRGEDLLAKPEPVLKQIANWLNIDDSDLAIEAMLHPERSPFATEGPPNARLGNDPGFLADPTLRPFSPPKVPLTARLPWRGDGEGFVPAVVNLARRFGYADDPIPAPELPQGFNGSWGPLVAIEPDGQGFPMAHGNLLDSSYVPLTPLREIRGIETKPDPKCGGGNFGAYTATDYALAVFDSPHEVPLEAIDLETGKVIWQSDLGDFPAIKDGLRGRFIGGALLAKLQFSNGRTRRCIFVGNRAEIRCIGLDGKTIWKRETADIVSELGSTARGHGTPRCLRYTTDNELLYGTRNGYLVKLDPLSGQTIDVVDLKTKVLHEGKVVEGRFDVRQSIVVHGDHAYLQAKFSPETEVASPQALPTALFRLKVSRTANGAVEHLPDFVSEEDVPTYAVVGSVGDRRVGGSPCARVREDGKLVIFTNEYPSNLRNSHGMRDAFQLSAIRDDGDALTHQWHCILREKGDAKVTAAPALDPVSDTLVVSNRIMMHLFANASYREGVIAPDLSLAPLDCLEPDMRKHATHAEFASPITIARDEGENGFVAYVGLAVRRPQMRREYAILSALQVQPGPLLSVTPLWSRSINVDDAGNALPAARSFAQPALFSGKGSGKRSKGILMGMRFDGLSVFR
ncbi:sulfotransferase family protein [Ruegeria profundi]|uniref:Sulfotransferase domain-containing protein n=1 Tax=Ruegeria profundi TaxID=1685378 RepID=A0A0X3TWJ4_9RHOB|nr:sulfotransferase [Ruegeria profundi]KUJ80075.1 hypothetical protein AVO44_07885 [Ruegeria profundi]